MQIDETGLARGLGIAVGHRHGGGFLQRQDIIDVGSLQQRVDQRQLRGARVAENIFDAFAASTEENIGATAGRGIEVED